MIAGDELAAGKHRALERRVSSASSSTPPSRTSAATQSRRRPLRRAITLFSDEQLVALSKVFERAIFGGGFVDVGRLVDDRR